MKLYEDLTFPKLADRPYVICNMVMTADGKATIAGGSHNIGGPTDHAIMEQLRSYADAILSGAGTLVKEDIVPFISEPYQLVREAAGKLKFPRAMTLTSRADLPFERKFFQPEYRPTVFFDGEDAEAIGEHAEVINVGKDSSLPDLMQHAKNDLGIDLLLHEGGPGLNHHMFAGGYIDELFLTLAPKLSGQTGISIIEGEKLLNLDLEIISVQADGDVVFLRYKVGQK